MPTIAGCHAHACVGMLADQVPEKYPMQLIVNGQSHEVAADSTVASLLQGLGLSAKPLAVEVNLQLVPRQRHAEHRLADGDRLEIVTLVGGG
jgi:sulfur carrier protein